MDKQQISIYTSVAYKELCAKELHLTFDDTAKQAFFKNVVEHAVGLCKVAMKVENEINKLK